MRITLIKDPDFTVELTSKQTQEGSKEIQITKIALQAIQGVGNLFKSFGKATYSTISYAPRTFKRIVLNDNSLFLSVGHLRSIPFFILRVCSWVGMMGFNILEVTVRNLTKHKDANILAPYIGDSMDPSHFRTVETAIDMSQVSPDVKMEDLFTIFDEIEWEDANSLKYVHPSLRSDNASPTPLSVELLREKLGVFLHNVKTRQALTGTPPAIDAENLEKFYKQIEDSVRSSLDILNKRIKKMHEENGADVTKFNPAAFKAYKKLISLKSRLALDLAFAGINCGARYLGEATDWYSKLSRGTSVPAMATLEGHIIERLAQERKEVATNLVAGMDTHKYNIYMATMGRILGFPGTKNIIEHLLRSFDMDSNLKDFFQIYTVNFIIDVINKEILESQPFREKVIDWIKANAKNWKKEEYEAKIPVLKAALSEVIDGKSMQGRVLEQIETFRTLSSGFAQEENEVWSEFVNRVVFSDAAKAHFSEKFKSPVDRRVQVNSIQVLCLREEVERVLHESYNKEKIEVLASEIEKVGQMQKILKEQGCRAEQNTLLSLIRKTTDLDVEIKQILESTRQEEFGSKINLGPWTDIDFTLEEELEGLLANPTISGLSKEIMEWLLVEHHVLVAQKSLEVSEPVLESVDADEEQENAYAKELYSLLPNDSYRYRSGSLKEIVMKARFDKAFDETPEVLIDKYESQGIQLTGYTKGWKFYHLQLPKTLSNISGNTAVRVVLIASAALLTIALSWSAYSAIERVVAAHLIPVLINNTPLAAINVMNMGWQAFDLLKANTVKTIVGGTILGYLLRQLPNTPILTPLGNALTLGGIIDFVYPQRPIVFVISLATGVSMRVWLLMKNVQECFNKMGEEAKKEYLWGCKQKLYPLWREAALA